MVQSDAVQLRLINIEHKLRSKRSGGREIGPSEHNLTEMILVCAGEYLFQNLFQPSAPIDITGDSEPTFLKPCHIRDPAPCLLPYESRESSSDETLTRNK